MSGKPTLRALIEAAGLTQRQAAEALGVSHRMLQYWLAEDGPHEPPRMALDALRWHGLQLELDGHGQPAEL